MPWTSAIHTCTSIRAGFLDIRRGRLGGCRCIGLEIALLETAALLHDVGKLKTPDAILRKQGPLTDAEREVVREHVTEGARLIETLGDPRLTAIVRHHHERFDGDGYPSRLKGEEIPLGARVVAVVLLGGA